MNAFLDQVYFNNSVRAYIVVGTTILVVVLFKKYIAHYLALAFFKILKIRWKNIDFPAFRSLAAKPLGLFFAVLITVTALDKLNLPSELEFSLYKITLRELLRMTGTFLIIFSFFQFIIKMIDFVMLMVQGIYMKEQAGQGTHQLVFFFKDLIKVLVALVGLLFILKYTFNYDIKGLLTGLSIVGAAVALALKESLENLIASFIIFFDKPFATGDAVKINAVSGVVEKIGLRSTRIRSDDKSFITVPNKQMVDSVLDNQSNRVQRRAELRLELSSSTSAGAIENLLSGIRQILSGEDILSSSAFVTGITANAILINCEYFTGANAREYSIIRERNTLKVLALMEQLNIATAQSVSDIKIVRDDDTPETQKH
ncbi:mechanosensitive ion channel family protein [Niabella drilacis]|uniref:MscS family membrane protein n=1 Tax=Niabella drilacis (strain DSM 25811 / CCM 8410 / CCUG 62505 / LMG 26954 / E90) TaxID=1285928 RepID=A0A1G6PSL6_NIADE|nr:mechanosensitive ion channel domain-containing protein [Niabella drilacis]SDC82365.1 MscS family membrane protein [Niabella drilacis]